MGSMQLKKIDNHHGRFLACVQVRVPVELWCILFVLVLMFGQGFARAQAGEFSPFYQNTHEVRNYVLTLIAEGRFSDEPVEIEYIQSSDRKKFKIYSTQENDNLEIFIVPDRNGFYDFPSISSWRIVFDKTGDLKEVWYYLQGSGKDRIEVKSHNSVIKVSLYIDDIKLYSEKPVPMSIRNFIKMPLGQFINGTYQQLYWEWVFPTENLMSLNIRAENFSNYLGTKLKEVIAERVDKNSYHKQKPLNSLEEIQLLISNREDEGAYLKKHIDEIMHYIGTKETDGSEFVPRDKNKELVSATSEEYPKIYFDRVVQFLSNFPELYTSIDGIKVPFHDEVRNRLNILYAELYFMASKYPGLLYIVPIVRSQTRGEEDVYTTIGYELFVPYFALDGTFVLFGYDLISQYLEEEKNSKGQFIRYWYDDIAVFRIPEEYFDFGPNTQRYSPEQLYERQ